jgi:hypothetical protein
LRDKRSSRHHPSNARRPAAAPERRAGEGRAGTDRASGSEASAAWATDARARRRHQKRPRTARRAGPPRNAGRREQRGASPSGQPAAMADAPPTRASGHTCCQPSARAALPPELASAPCAPVPVVAPPTTARAPLRCSATDPLAKRSIRWSRPPADARRLSRPAPAHGDGRGPRLTPPLEPSSKGGSRFADPEAAVPPARG